MRITIFSIASFLCLATIEASTGIDGRWTAEVQSRAKKPGKNQGTATLNLTSDGKQVSGTVSQGKRPLTIQDGKVDGSSFSFVTVRRGKKGESRVVWKGTVDGDQIHGTRSREGGKRGMSFTAKRSLTQ